MSERIKEFTDSILLDIVKCANEVFCHGLYVKSNDHPCGWDFIDFTYMDEDDLLNYEFENSDICDGCYDSSQFEGMTLKEILEKADGRFAFEVGGIDW